MKRIIFLSFIILSFSLFNLSRNITQSKLVESLISPFDNEEIVVGMYIESGLEIDQLIDVLISSADKTSVSFHSSILNENTKEYYWMISDEKHLKNLVTLNKEISLEKFNNLKNPIESNNFNLEHHFSFLEGEGNYFLYHFKEIEEIPRHINVTAATSEDLKTFITLLKNNRVSIFESEDIRPTYNILYYLTLALTYYPITLIAISLIIISEYLIIHNDRRSISIYLVNGFRKLEYNKRIVKILLKVGISTSLITFAILQIVNPSNLNHFLSIFAIYSALLMILLFIFSMLSVVFIYSLTEVTTKSYLFGFKKTSFSEIFVSGFKIIISLILAVSLLGIVNGFHWMGDVLFHSNNNAKINTEMYTILENNQRFSLLSESSQIIENIKNLDNGILIDYKIDTVNEEKEPSEVEKKLIFVNDEFIKRQNLLFDSGSKVSDFKLGAVYVQEKNKQLINEESLSLLGLPVTSEIVIIANESTIVPYSNNVIRKSKVYEKDFILVNREINENTYLFNILFEIPNEIDKDNIGSALLDKTNIEKIEFNNLGKQFQLEFDLTASSIYIRAQWTLVYILVIIIISLIYYQVKFDKVKKEFTIYIASGINKLNTFYYDIFYQSIISIVIVLIAKNLYYPAGETYYAWTVIIIFLIIDVIVLVISINNLYKNVVNSLKERS